MSKECPHSGARCHDPLCEGSICLRKRDKDPLEEYIRNRNKEVQSLEDKLFHILNKQLEIIDRLTREREHPKHQRVEQVLYFIFNNNKYIITMLSIASNQSAPIVLGLIDSDTRLPVTATFTGETETSDNTDVATIDPVLGLVAVKTNTTGGSGNLTSVATWTYTDSKTLLPVTVQKTTVTPFTVTPVITAENVEMVVTLGTPVTQP